jgi:hypothetical protein
MTDLPVSGLIGLGALILIVMGFVRDVQGGKYKSALTTVITWVVGIIAVTLYAHSMFGDTVVISGIRLNDMDFVTLVLIGLQVSSFAGTIWTVTKAIDNTQSAAKPQLLGGDKPPA